MGLKESIVNLRVTTSLKKAIPTDTQEIIAHILGIPGEQILWKSYDVKKAKEHISC